MKITAETDSCELRQGRRVSFLGPSWIERTSSLWKLALEQRPEFIAVDLSNISFVTLLDWVNTVALIDLIIDRAVPRQVDLDILGKSDLRLLDASSFLAAERSRPTDTLFTSGEIHFSEDKYRLAGFLESLDTYGVLNRPSRSTKVMYPGLSRQRAALRSFYAPRGNQKPTVVLGLQRIETKEHCKSFLSDAQILNWRRAMDERFRKSPLFESDEVWRVFCHELATNIWEHSGSIGYIAARVIDSSIDAAGRLRPWCKWTYPSELHELLRRIRGGFLELCVADAGQGFIDTLNATLTERLGTDGFWSTADILAFAFDELGTCKREDESWATTRHGLCRILGLVSKYGGALRLRSGNAEITYIAEKERFRRCRNNLGYEPQVIRSLSSPVLGAQFQLILPLIPLFERPREERKASILEFGLPESFRTQATHFRGHLVPILEQIGKADECIGGAELREFREQCERLSRDLLTTRPRYEPLVLDFSGLRWQPGQFETFLYLLQNVLQHRPALLVEVDDLLADSVIEHERNGLPTKIPRDLLKGTNGAAHKAFDEVSEHRFLETYSGVHLTVLGVTKNTRRTVIFGLPSSEYQTALLSLLEQPKTIEKICQCFPKVEESILRAILTNANPLFEVRNSLWGFSWSPEAIAIESTRAMVEHFDLVAVRSEAWRGRLECRDTGKERFYIPWSNVWRKEFLQASRLLNRGRQADEIAQRLLYRLGIGLSKAGKNISDIKVLVGVSAPAMLLATALHRWWPTDNRPMVVDIGHYVFLGETESLPEVTTKGGIALVQDVLDDGKITRLVVEQLKSQGCDVLIVLALVRLVDNAGEASISDNFSLESTISGTDLVFLLNVQRPADASPPDPSCIEDSIDYLVEPRSLRPVKLKTLRREFFRDRDPDLDRRNDYLERFDNSSDGCLIASGHFVYGMRHFAVTVDVRRSLTGQIGDEIARWLADVCEGIRREKVPWEREEGYNLSGDVTAVLMPLHSQIHYLWPKVESILAQRGRRQPIWLLEPALFNGSGPAYGLPLQFVYQIRQTVAELKSSDHGDTPRLRILVLDDAIATGKTATAVLSSILGEAQEAQRAIGLPKAASGQGPVEWVRYFSLLNESDHPSHLLWRNIVSLSQQEITFVMEEYAPFMGVSVFNENGCPICRDRSRLVNLLRISEEFGAQGVHAWLQKRIEELKPLAIDGAGFGQARHPRLKGGLAVLTRQPSSRDDRNYKALHVDTAIWRFYELMYLTYPPSEMLSALNDAWLTELTRAEEESGVFEREYERYRWAVYEWCLRNWRRVVADSGSEIFCTQALKEIELATGLVERLLEAIGTRYSDQHLQNLIYIAIERLSVLERGRREEGKGADPQRIDQAIQLDTGLQLFFFNVQRLDRKIKPEPSIHFKMLLGKLDQAASTLDKGGPSFLRNLHRRLTRPSRFADPAWTLEVLAESLFRGRRGVQHVGSHQLLPKLLHNVMRGSSDKENLRLLQGSLVLFLAALDDLLPYAEVEFSVDLAEIKELCINVLGWLRGDPERILRNRTPALRRLFEALKTSNNFCVKFNEVFHEDISAFLMSVRKYAEATAPAGQLTFTSFISEELGSSRMLTHMQRLYLMITNRVVDPVLKTPRPSRSCIFASRVNASSPAAYVSLRLMTTFADAPDTQRLIAESRNTQAEEGLLKSFGVKIGKWETPKAEDLELGFLAQNEILVPLGFEA